jgi:hypothetical protein
LGEPLRARASRAAEDVVRWQAAEAEQSSSVGGEGL